MESTTIDQPQWRPIAGFEGVYEVSDVGQVRRVGGIGYRRLFKRSSGYVAIFLTDRGKSACKMVHTLVLEAFAGPRPAGFVARHLNGLRDDNRARNLAWGTQKQNADDMRRHGTDPVGERNGRAKLDSAAVIEIRGSSMPIGVLAEAYGVSLRTVRYIRAGLTWRHL